MCPFAVRKVPFCRMKCILLYVGRWSFGSTQVSFLYFSVVVFCLQCIFVHIAFFMFSVCKAYKFIAVDAFS